jgi:TolB-like protein
MLASPIKNGFREEQQVPFPAETPASNGEISPESVRGQVARILASRGFVRSRRLGQFLRFTVSQVLDGKQADLKEYLVGVEVFDKLDSFDPRIDSIVRVEARRLRAKLEQYYRADGAQDPVVICFPKGSYVPLFLNRQQAQGLLDQTGTRPTSVSVAGFANLTADMADDSFCSGRAEDLISGLTKRGEVRVVVKPGDAVVFPDNTRADFMIEGSVRRHDSRLRISAQLIDAQTGVYVWSDTFERDTSDVFAVQEEISRRIVSVVVERPRV